jgi:hypothetical protein
MDLQSFDFKDTEAQKVTLQNPVTGETLLGEDGEPIWFSVYGSDSKQFRSATRAFGNKKLSKGGRGKVTLEEIEETSDKILAASTAGWSGNFTVYGEPLECNPENAEYVYKEFTWLKEQIDAFVNERANFLKSA